jgi:hypothetical protein
LVCFSYNEYGEISKKLFKKIENKKKRAHRSASNQKTIEHRQ